jgi:hypothetical protein
VDAEIWPTNVVIEKGGKIVSEVSSGDTQGNEIFSHDSEIDRSRRRFAGVKSTYLFRGGVGELCYFADHSAEMIEYRYA